MKTKWVHPIDLLDQPGSHHTRPSDYIEVVPVADVHHNHTALLEALKAIVARIQGEYDHPALVKYGPLNTNMIVDVLAMAKTAATGKE